MVRRLNQAALRAERYIENKESRLFLVAHMASTNKLLFSSDPTISKKAAVMIRKRMKVDFALGCKDSHLKGDTDVKLSSIAMNSFTNSGIVRVIYRGERIPAMIGVCKNDKWLTIAGRFISISFIEDLEEFTVLKWGFIFMIKENGECQVLSQNQNSKNWLFNMKR